MKIKETNIPIFEFFSGESDRRRCVWPPRMWRDVNGSSSITNVCLFIYLFFFFNKIFFQKCKRRARVWWRWTYHLCVHHARDKRGRSSFFEFFVFQIKSWLPLIIRSGPTIFSKLSLSFCGQSLEGKLHISLRLGKKSINFFLLLLR